MSKKNEKGIDVVVYQTPSGAIEMRGDISRDTIWATLDQIADVFERDKSVISRHLTNIFNEGELKRNSVVAKIATTATDGKTYQVVHYNLDATISVTLIHRFLFPLVRRSDDRSCDIAFEVSNFLLKKT